MMVQRVAGVPGALERRSIWEYRMDEGLSFLDS